MRITTKPPYSSTRLLATFLLGALLLGCDRAKTPPAPPQSAASPPAVEAQKPTPPVAEAQKPAPPAVEAELRDNAIWDGVVDARGVVWATYRDMRSRVVLQRLSPGDGEGLYVIDVPQHEPVDPRVIATEAGLELLWRPKIPHKELKYGRMQPGVPGGELFSKVIDKASEPLADYRLWSKDGQRVAVWLGEALTEGNRFNYYLNGSTDSGANWSETRLLGPSKKWASLFTNEAVVIFLWGTDQEGRRTLTQRTFDLATHELLREKRVEEAPFIASDIKAIESNGRWILAWVSQRDGSNASLVVEGRYSDDKGLTWTPLSLSATQGMNAGPLHFAADRKGNLLLAFYRAPTDVGTGEKDDIVLLRSRDNGATWQLMQPLRPRELAITKAKDIAIHYDPPTEEVLVAWQDYRDILTNVYVAKTKDWGDNWSQPIPVGHPGVDRLGLAADEQAIIRTGDVRQLIVEEYTDPRFVKKRLRLVNLDQLFDQGGAGPQPAPAGRDADTLRARVMAFWELFEKGDYAAAYDFQDPTFRAFQSRDEYLKQRGKIKYHAYEIEDLSLRGNVADVKMRIEASIPPMDLGGKEVSRPKAERRLPERWLFVGGEWYREYYDEVKNVGFISY